MQLHEARILIVDDEPALLRIFAKWLIRIGCSVLTAGDGHEALEVIERSQIDVLVTDIRMPGMDGVTLIRRLAKAGKRIPYIIFVSGFGEIDVREMYQLGVEGFLAKPFRVDELHEMLRFTLSDRRDLWKAPMPQTPQNHAELTGIWTETPPGPEEPPAAEPENCFRLGRGGFRARTTNIVAPGKVVFRCRVTDASGALLIVLNGQGTVRWRSKTDAAAGIAFEYLEPSSHAWIIDQLARTNPCSFIPA